MGMGPRIREDTEGEWVPALVFTGASSRWKYTGGCTPILTFPLQGEVKEGEGWVPSVFTEVGTPRERWGWVPAYARTTDGGEGGRGGWAGGVAGGAAFEYNGLKYPQIPVV